ncbi:MAG: glycosyltransferase [Gemmatimonadota bacterium]
MTDSSTTKLEAISLPEYIAGRDEALAGEQSRVLGEAPEGHALVVAVSRFRYMDLTREVNDLMLPGQQFYMDASRVEANVANGLVHVPHATRLDWWNAAGRILAAEPADDVHPLATEPTEGALKIVAGVGYDPGAAAFRLHTAINETTKHTSAFVRYGHSNPHCDLRQYDSVVDGAIIRDAVLEADVIHCHVATWLINNTGLRPRPEQLLIKHYHGSAQHGSHLEPMLDRAMGVTVLGARLSLVAEAKTEGLDMHWSPIPVPVQRYRALRDAVRQEAGWTPLEGAATTARPLRIAHSPTNEMIKGSSVLRDVVHQLQKQGVPVEVEWIRGVSLEESLRRKALCDVAFDSFWLGIQGSGLEAGAMELPVIAGDSDVRGLYNELLDYCPYTFANDAAELSEAIEAFAMDAGVRAFSSQKVARYVEQYHDYAAVADRYERTLAKVLGRDDVLTWGG